MAIEKHTLPNSDTAIWAETANLNYFVTTPIEPDTAGEVTNQQVSVPSHNRKPYPGALPGPGVSSHTRTILVDPGRKSGSAIPGKPFMVDDGTEKRQMRYDGTWIDVHAYFTGNVPAETKLYSPTGTRYIIDGPAAATVMKAKAAPKPASV